MAMFYCRKTATGYYFKLAATNGATLGTSDEYASEQNCLDAIQLVKGCALDAEVEDQTAAAFKKRKNPKFELYKDNAGQYHFKLNAKNGDMLLISPGYTSKMNCQEGLENVQSGALTASTVKEEALV
jgi:uncharacterized protein YegP (UPF0339 family)